MERGLGPMAYFVLLPGQEECVLVLGTSSLESSTSMKESPGSVAGSSRAPRERGESVGPSLRSPTPVWKPWPQGPAVRELCARRPRAVHKVLVVASVNS